MESQSKELSTKSTENSLEQLLDEEEDKSKLKIIRSEFSNLDVENFNLETLNLHTRKGVFSYEYIDSIDKLNETSLPPRELFHSSLTDETASDTCSSHTSRVARAALNAMFPDKWIGKYGLINYPPRSPDLTIVDYYFWGRIKDLVYHERLTTRDDMILRIIEAIRSLSAEEILRSIHSFQNRVDVCIAENGAHFEHLIA
ncbi:hypothetical protein ALC57_06180 [Trachymyrmex cornetzi]|uniref:Uncharacterized protein n=1 Tax=Trachymyrmex cornetzi TaxID=471704 RepID=A0A151J8Z3_9HYME|nr:hypothetical protein ALC57_06180 [Trachymyrmex cornetzi]